MSTLYTSRHKRLMIALALVIALAGALLLTITHPSPASAAGAKKYYQGRDYVKISADYKAADVCDREEDGNGVYARFLDYTGEETFRLHDGNGSEPPCGKSRALPVGRYIWVEICEDTWGWDDCKRHQVI